MVDAETTPARPWRTLRWPVYPSALGLVMIAVAFVMAAAAACSRRKEFSLLVGVVGIFWVAASLSLLLVALFVVHARAQR